MSSTPALPTDLEFLRPYIRDGEPRYRYASWLKSSFDALVWRIYTHCWTIIDWRVPVGKDKILLTSPAYASVLELFRSFLILQTHIDNTGGRIHGAITQHRKIQHALDCLDCLLLGAERLNLREHGLLAISSNDYCSMLAQILSDRRTSTAIYDWPHRAATYLRKQSMTLDDIDVANALTRAPFLTADIPDRQDRLTDLADDEIVRARIWLWRQQRYLLTQGGKHGFRYIPEASLFFAELYDGTLGGKTGWPQIPELGLLPGHRVQFEFPKAPIKSDDRQGVTRNKARLYRQALCSLNILRCAGLPVAPVPVTQLKALSRKIYTKPDGRFRTLPREVFFSSLRKALAFALDHGAHLINSFVNLAVAARGAKLSTAIFAEKSGVTNCLDPHTIELGVKSWTIEPCYAGSGVMKNAPVVLTGPDYFLKLRQNVGLYELLMVLFGAIEIVLGTLSARRIGELGELECDKCLDPSRTRLVFQLRKSGAIGCRETVLRPIPPVAVEMVEMLQGLQRRLVEAGLLESTRHLLAVPLSRRETILATGYSSARYNEAIDFFCDYVQMPLDEYGRRYYLRTHQLRRFFALLFFWGAGFGSLETLRYYLGHSNVEHLWHYITEAIPGSVLRGAKAEYVADVTQRGTPDTSLADLLESNFGTRNFQLVDAEVLSAHFEHLIEEGLVDVEPCFLDSGARYRIAIVVSPRGIRNET